MIGVSGQSTKAKKPAEKPTEARGAHGPRSCGSLRAPGRGGRAACARQQTLGMGWVGWGLGMQKTGEKGSYSLFARNGVLFKKPARPSSRRGGWDLIRAVGKRNTCHKNTQKQNRQEVCIVRKLTLKTSNARYRQKLAPLSTWAGRGGFMGRRFCGRHCGPGRRQASHSVVASMHSLLPAPALIPLGQ